MTPQLFIELLALFIVFNISFMFSGLNYILLFAKLLNQEKIDLNLPMLIGVSWLMGIGFFAHFGLITSLLSLFYKETITLYLVAHLIISFFLKRNHLFFLHQLTKTKWKQLFHPLVLGLLLFSGLIIVSLYLVALKPPLVSDELHYHLPQAKEIVATHSIYSIIQGNSIYANIPKLVEILFAEGIILQGLEMTHLFHFSLLLAFFLFLFGFLTEKYTIKTASVAIFLLVILNEYTLNAVTAFIDTATVSFEITALLFFAHWLQTKNKIHLLFSVLFISFALSSKYSALFSALYILLMLLIYLLQTKQLKTFFGNKKLLMLSILMIFFIASFWYIKNFFLHHNPTYPLYFGHTGMTEDEYTSLINAIQEFGDRSLTQFLTFPFRYFGYLDLTVFFSFYLSLLCLFFKKNKHFVYSLVIYYLFYFGYWFFLATHQTRFLMPSIIVSLILLSILFTQTSRKYYPALILTTLSLFIFGYLWKPFMTDNMLRTWYQNKLHTKDRIYGLGRVNKETLLFWQFGCQYSVIDYLAKNNFDGAVIDNWTVWHDQSASFYSYKNKYLSFYFPESTSSPSLKKQLNERGIKYLYFKDSIKSNFSKEIDPVEQEYFQKRIMTERFLLQNSTEVYSDIDCHLYRINHKLL